MTSTKLARWKPGTKRSRTSALTLPKVVPGLGAIPSVKASRMRRVKSGQVVEYGADVELRVEAQSPLATLQAADSHVAHLPTPAGAPLETLAVLARRRPRA
jgi:hypothetical protein